MGSFNFLISNGRNNAGVYFTNNSIKMVRNPGATFCKLRPGLRGSAELEVPAPSHYINRSRQQDSLAVAVFDGISLILNLS